MPKAPHNVDGGPGLRNSARAVWTNGRCGSAVYEPIVRCRPITKVFGAASELGRSILAASQPSSCRPTTDRGYKAAPFKELPLNAESGGATRAALLAMRAHRGTGSSNPLPSSGESGANSRLPPGVQAVIVILGNHEFAAKSVPSAAPTAADHRGGSESLLSLPLTMPLVKAERGRHRKRSVNHRVEPWPSSG